MKFRIPIRFVTHLYYVIEANSETEAVIKALALPLPHTGFANEHCELDLTKMRKMLDEKGE